MVVPSHKGGAFERKVAKQLSLWITKGEDNSQLIRSVSSGGWKYRKSSQVGDLAPNGEEGERFRALFSIECKKRQEFDWKHVFTSDNPGMLQWWIKHATEAAEHELVPMIVWQKNYHRQLVGLPPYIVCEALGGGRSIKITWEKEVDLPPVEFVPIDLLLDSDPQFLYDSATAYLSDPHLRVRWGY